MPKASGLLLGFLFDKSGIYLILFDARRRISALTEILLFSAIAHHTGMGNVSWLIRVLRNRWLIYHIKYFKGSTIFSSRRKAF